MQWLDLPKAFSTSEALIGETVAPSTHCDEVKAARHFIESLFGSQFLIRNCLAQVVLPTSIFLFGSVFVEGLCCK